MLKPDQIEEVISLINAGIDEDILVFELGLPEKTIKEFAERLFLRKYAREVVITRDIDSAVGELEEFINNNEYNIVEKFILIKVKAYKEKRALEESDFDEIKGEKKKIGLTKNLNTILEELSAQIPQKKVKKKNKIDYRDVINKYQEDIKKLDEEAAELEVQNSRRMSNEDREEFEKRKSINSSNSINARNILAFTYYKAGMIDESREELFSLIADSNNFTAYRQLINLEKEEENYEEAKGWAKECLESYPNSIVIREQLIEIAKNEENKDEVIRILKDILSIEPNNPKILDRVERAGNSDNIMEI